MNMRRLLTGVCVAFMAAAIWGCAGSNNEAPPFKDGEHPAGWSTGHGSWVVTYGVNSCVGCHGEGLTGGISKVACSRCHGDSLVFEGTSAAHPAGWVEDVPSSTVQNQEAIRKIPFYNFSAPYHGFVAKGAPSAGAERLAFGFGYCMTCHDVATTRNLRIGRVPACNGCHGGAPHSLNEDWAAFHHITTDPANAAFCARCHTGHANLGADFVAEFTTLNAFDPSVSPSENGCFNGTLCHNTNVVQDPVKLHAPKGLDISAHTIHGTQHELNGQSCKICHGEKLQGRGAASACSNCHGAQPATGQSAVYLATICASCHRAEGSAPLPKHCADCHTAANPPENICLFCHGAE